MTKNEKEVDKLRLQFEYFKNTTFKRAMKNACKDVASRLVDGTPHFFRELDTSGRTKNNWNVTFDGSIDESFNIEASPDFSGDMRKSQLRAEIESTKFTKDTIVTFSNATPWIMKLEYGGYPLAPKVGSVNPVTKQTEIRSTSGYSNQAPLGIRAIVELEWESIIRQAVQTAIR